MASSASLTSFVIGRTALYLTAGLVIQTLFFGAYTIIIFLSTRMLIRRGLKPLVDRTLLIITLFMYLLSAAYWMYSFADVVDRLQNYIKNPQNPSSPVAKWLALFNALVLLNYVLSDAIVIWRARLISAPEDHKYIYLPIFFMLLASLSVIALIGLRIASVSKPTIGESNTFVITINTLQISNLGMSLISNLSATGVVGVTAWRHRQAIRTGFQKTTQGNEILRLLLESGVLYCISGVLMLVFAFIRLPYNTLGDLYTPITVQIAGAYTPIVLLLVSTKRSLSDASLLGTIPPDSPFQFPALSPAVSNRPVLSVQCPAHSDSNMGGELNQGFGKRHYEKGHRTQISDSTLV